MQEESFTFPRYELKGKVAVVTGSGQGLGKWIALGLAEAGADVVVADLNVKTAEETAREIEAMGRKALFVEVDVGRVDAVVEMMDKAKSELGGLE